VVTSWLGEAITKHYRGEGSDGPVHSSPRRIRSWKRAMPRDVLDPKSCAGIVVQRVWSAVANRVWAVSILGAARAGAALTSVKAWKTRPDTHWKT
jgi:hypothetical protein